jgi:hypothetical protein
MALSPTTAQNLSLILIYIQEKVSSCLTFTFFEKKRQLAYGNGGRGDGEGAK